MKPSEKSPEMEAALKGVFGIDRVADIEADRCSWCHGRVKEFRDALSEKEYSISGFCQKCQDQTFGGGDAETFSFDREKKLLELDKPAREFYIPTDNDYVIERQPMVCGSAEAESRKYHKYVGKSGKIWLVADQEDAASNVYVEGGPNSDGFAGRTLTFSLVEGGEVSLKGPWHANSDSLFADTGVDVRDRVFTFVVISRDRKSGEHYESIMVDVLYRDEEPQLGSFHRGDVLARQWAKEIGAPVFLYSQSKGGSSCGQVKPDQVFYWERDNKASIATAAQDAVIRS